MDMLEDYVEEEHEQDDGSTMKPNEIFSMLSQVLYNRRNKMDPFYNQLVVAGFRDGKCNECILFVFSFFSHTQNLSLPLFHCSVFGVHRHARLQLHR
jgi:hypothetical protein